MMGKFQEGSSEQLIRFGGLFMVFVRASKAIKNAYQEASVGSYGVCVYDGSALVVESFKGVCLHWEGDKVVAGVKNGSNSSNGSLGNLIKRT